VALARMAGLELDPWQALVLEHSLGERPDGRWAAFEVGVNVPRQNGKGSILEARELAGLFLLNERLIIHSAHLFDTSLEAFRRLLSLIEDTPELSREVKRVSRAHGEEGIELKSGQRVRFRTRTKGGGRGFSADLVVLDEVMLLAEAALQAILPTLSARPNPQVWYAGSAVDQLIHDHGMVWSRVRERGMAGEDPALVYAEWSVDAGGLGPSEVSPDLLDSEEAWAEANPGLDIRISREYVGNERRAMDPRSFAVERLGVGDWPDTSPEADAIINARTWRALADPAPITGAVAFAFDVTPSRGHACIVAAGFGDDDRVHVEVVAHERGTGWVAERLAELVSRWEPVAVLCDGASPAASLEDEVVEAGVVPRVVAGGDYARACGGFFDAVEQGRLRHRGTHELEVAVRGAATRPLVDAWAWSRKQSRVDISPLVAATLAAHAVVTDRDAEFTFEVLG
jgi:hypothetical protein